MVFLHGATLDHHAWDPQVNVLREHYRTVAVDLRGHGESTMDARRFDFNAAVDDVTALLHRLRAAPVALVGLSLGGNIAQEIVYRSPELVDALVVADSTCNTASRHPLEAAWAIAALASLGMTSRETFLQRAAAATAQDAAVQQYVLDVNAHRSNRDATQIVASMLASGLHADPDYRLPIPTLLVHGDGDRDGRHRRRRPRLGRARAAGPRRHDPQRRARQQPGQPGGLHRRARRVPRAGAGG